MKKLIRLEHLLVAALSSLGYGLGYAFPKLWEKSEAICILSCMVCGGVLDVIGGKLIKTKWAQRSTTNKVLTVVSIAGAFLLIVALSPKVMQDMIWECLEVGIFIFSLGVSVVGYLISLFIHGLKSYLIQRRYKDGTTGHTMSEEELEYMESLKGENHEITGEYDKALAVKTENGIFVAKEDSKVLEFLGIPYAKPPVGSLRWKAPQKPEPSQKVWEAYYFGASCLQEDKGTYSLKAHTQSEDCLTLNVWTAADKKKNGKLRPVLVYVPGGNYAIGGSAEPLYHGRYFVKEHPEIIVVSFNYRLGIFGFADFSGLPGSEAYEDTRNLGIMDQILALQWIHDNIRAFGGDPDNVMLAGDTAGAGSITILSTLKETKDLFQKALLISCNYSRLCAEETPAVILNDIKKTFGVQTMDDLLRVPAEKLKQLVDDNIDVYGFMPVVDGKLIKKEAEQAIRDGDAGDIRFIFGIPANEISVWMMVGAEDRMFKWIADMNKELIHMYKGTENEGKMEKIIEFYKGKGIPEKEVQMRAMEYWIYKYSPLMNCRNLSKQGKTVRGFYWDVKSAVKKYGGNSISTVGALLGNDDAAQHLGEIFDMTIMKVFQKLICNELLKNKPEIEYEEVKGVDALKWKAFTPEKTPVLHVTNSNMEMDETCLAEDMKTAVSITG